MIARSDWFEEHRHELRYQIDGIVVRSMTWRSANGWDSRVGAALGHREEASPEERNATRLLTSRSRWVAPAE